MSINPKALAATAVQTFAEEWTDLSLWDGTKGRWLTTYLYAPPLGNGCTLDGNGEQEWYINNRYAPTQAFKPWTVAGSILTITADKAPAALQSLINNYKYYSGQLNTSPSFSQTYGYFECRAKLPKGQGLWPAFWLLPQSGKWPPEIDVMEVLGHELTKLYTTVHTNSTGKHTSDGKGITVADMSADFHLYGMDWQSDFIVFYFDRAEVFRTPTPSDLNQPMYLILNLAVGGNWPGMVDDTTPFPAQMQVDYVRAYKALSIPVTPPPAPPYVPPPAPSPSGGIVLTGDDAKPMQVLTGTLGDDIFYPGRSGSTMLGNGGANTYIWKALPWGPSLIKDFKVGIDKLDFSKLSATPVQQTFLEDYGGDGTIVKFKDPSFVKGLYAMVVLERVPLAGLTPTKLFNSTPAPSSAFGTALAAFVDSYTTTPAAEKIVELKKQITRLTP